MKSKVWRPLRWRKNFTPGQAVRQATFSLSQFVEKNKNLTVERGWNDHLFLDPCPKDIASAALSTKLYCFGVEVTPAY